MEEFKGMVKEQVQKQSWGVEGERGARYEKLVEGLQPWVMEEAVREVVIQSEKDQTLEGLR